MAYIHTYVHHVTVCTGKKKEIKKKEMGSFKKKNKYINIY